MKDTVDSKKVVGSFVGKYIALAIIIGGISFVLENLIPQFVDWDFTSTFIIYQTVLFVISTILTITFAVNFSIKKVKIQSEEEAKKISKPIKTILIFVALCVMIGNLIYCYQIEQSGYKDAEEEVKTIQQDDDFKEEWKKCEKNRIHNISNIYLATKEITTILTYAYAIIYIDKMITLAVEKKTANEKSTKKTTKKTEEEKEDNE